MVILHYMQGLFSEISIIFGDARRVNRGKVNSCVYKTTYPPLVIHALYMRYTTQKGIRLCSVEYIKNVLTKKGGREIDICFRFNVLAY